MPKKRKAKQEKPKTKTPEPVVPPPPAPPVEAPPPKPVKPKETDIQKIPYSRTANIEIKMNPHFDNWKPRENLRQLKRLVHRIVKVSLTRIGKPSEVTSPWSPTRSAIFAPAPGPVSSVSDPKPPKLLE